MDKITYLGIDITKICEFLNMDEYMRSHPVLGFWEHTLMMLVAMVIVSGLIFFLFSKKKPTTSQISLFCILLQILFFLVTIIFILGGSLAAWITGVLFLVTIGGHRMFCRHKKV